MGVVLEWTLLALYQQPGRTTWATYFHDLNKRQGVNTWPGLRSAYFSFLCRAASGARANTHMHSLTHTQTHTYTGPLNLCKVSSHTHPTLLSHWVQAAFVTSTQQDFSLASVSTEQSTGWLPALLISFLLPS